MNLVIECIFTSSIKNPTDLYNCRWLDKLGVSAKEGMGVVMRQTFSKGNNALTDSNNLPNPVSSFASLHCYPLKIIPEKLKHHLIH